MCVYILLFLVLQYHCETYCYVLNLNPDAQIRICSGQLREESLGLHGRGPHGRGRCGRGRYGRGRPERQWASHMSSNPGFRSLCNHEPTFLYLKSFIWKYEASAFIKTDTRALTTPSLLYFSVHICVRTLCIWVHACTLCIWVHVCMFTCGVQRLTSGLLN